MHRRWALSRKTAAEETEEILFGRISRKIIFIWKVFELLSLLFFIIFILLLGIAFWIFISSRGVVLIRFHDAPLMKIICCRHFGFLFNFGSNVMNASLPFHVFIYRAMWLIEKSLNWMSRMTWNNRKKKELNGEQTLTKKKPFIINPINSFHIYCGGKIFRWIICWRFNRQELGQRRRGRERAERL